MPEESLGSSLVGRDVRLRKRARSPPTTLAAKDPGAARWSFRPGYLTENTRAHSRSAMAWT